MKTYLSRKAVSVTPYAAGEQPDDRQYVKLNTNENPYPPSPKAVEAYRQYGRFAKCARCELLAFCRGCPAVASGKSGDFYAPDPQCWKAV